MNKKLLFFILPFLFCCHLIFWSCKQSNDKKSIVNEETPFPLELMENSIKSLSPEADPEDWLLAHVDVETTGLLPGYHEMIDIGVVITNLKGRIIDTLFLRVQPQFPDRISPIAKEINAYDFIKWEKLGALSVPTAVDSLIDFHKRTTGGHPILMIAFNAHFDLSFLDYLFRTAGHSWREIYHYFVLDIPSMAWGLGYQDLHLKRFLKEFSIEDEPHIAEQHTGISGAMKNVRIYQKLMSLSD